jgi:hypothetical protein
VPGRNDTTDASSLRDLQRHSFDYFVHEVNREKGLVLDKTERQWPASIAAMGLALTAYLVGAERGFMARAEAAERTLAMLRFLAGSEQGEAPTASGHHGFYYHFLHMRTGRRDRDCELSSIDTALLIAGVLAAGEYFHGDGAEAEIRDRATALYERIDWSWMLDGDLTLRHGWTPEGGFLPFRWEGYDEALILYFLALGSPTHAIDPKCYQAWCRSYEWKKIYDIEFLYAGPLFVHQMSHIWCDLRGVRDEYMRERQCDYFENSRRATLVQQQYAIHNPQGFTHYSERCWGITASDGPGNVSRRIDGVERHFFDYVARGVPYGPDDGTVSPWAVAASLPFAPEIVTPTIGYLRALHVHTRNPYGFKASFNPAFRTRDDDDRGWVSAYHFGVNEGPTVLMIENHRSGLVWELMRRCKPLVAGMKAAGFTGGWLQSPMT